ncbi:MAG: lipoprotein signal peptidase [Flavobacterium sp.]|nr:lipoprotein signal peptidase [Flavobacterium sp.]
MKLFNAIMLILFILIIDQFSKFFVKTNFLYGEEFQVFSWFKVNFIENEGMAWGTVIPGKYGKLILVIFRIIAVCGIGYWLWDVTSRNKSAFLAVAVSLIFAGAFGNIIDSVYYAIMFDNSTPTHLATFFPPDHYGTWFQGRVVDMFYFPIWEGFFPEWIPKLGGQPFTFFNAIFNVADFSISVGVGILIFFNKRAFAPPKARDGVTFSSKVDHDPFEYDPNERLYKL